MSEGKTGVTITLSICDTRIKSMNPLSLSTLSADNLAQAAADNLAEHASWVQQRTHGMRVVDSGDVLFADCGLPCDTFNQVCRARFTPDSAPLRIRETIAYYAGIKRPFSWWLSPGDTPAHLGDLLQEAGLERAETEVAMAADLAHLQVNDVSPDGLQIRRVRTSAELMDFAHILAANWTPPDADVLRFYEMAAPVLLNEDAPLWQYTGYVDGTPAAAAELAVGGGVVGIYSVCTLEYFRRRGFGTALTLQPLLDARAQGHRTAILQAAVNLYERIGFRAFGQITEYKPVS
jgi:ribosomal protein S18 acetylase RimI-like enzyme